MKKTLVLAGNHKQYESYLRQHGLDHCNYVYAATSRDIRTFCWDNCDLIGVGEYWLSNVIEDDNGWDLLNAKFPGWREKLGL
jgi:hypothetical protein